jgi:hypothetical protein|tara:strand:- start:41 stop:190 length:150 start_codon:yes stop_codon:yes gene_type:complete
MDSTERPLWRAKDFCPNANLASAIGRLREATAFAALVAVPDFKQVLERR